VIRITNPRRTSGRVPVILNASTLRTSRGLSRAIFLSHVFLRIDRIFGGQQVLLGGGGLQNKSMCLNLQSIQTSGNLPLRLQAQRNSRSAPQSPCPSSPFPYAPPSLPFPPPPPKSAAPSDESFFQAREAIQPACGLFSTKRSPRKQKALSKVISYRNFRRTDLLAVSSIYTVKSVFFLLFLFFTRPKAVIAKASGARAKRSTQHGLYRHQA